MVTVFKTLRSRIALLLIAANLPVIALAVWIGVRDFVSTDLVDRDRLVQAAALISARASGFPIDGTGAADAWRDLIFRDRGSRTLIAAALVGPDGKVLVRDGEAAPYGDGWLPEDGPPKTALASDPRILKSRGADGRAYRYAIAPVRNSEARAIVAAPFDFFGRSQTQWLLLALGLPALMSLLCVGLVLFGIERFVLRWIRALRATAASYNGGRLDGAASRLDGAPSELVELGETLEAMSQRIADRSNALETAVDQRDRLLRELHHRVKNNFQMIASLLALQRQEAPETLSAILRAPEDRVRAMAAAYKASYAAGEIGHVEVSDLIRDVAQQARQINGGRTFEVAARFPEDSGEIDLDRAVSLALLVMELLSAASVACESAEIAAEPRPDGRLALTITGPTSPWSPPAGLSQRLVNAYADQLGTAIEELPDNGRRIVVALASDKPSIGMKPRPVAA
jgi:two-component sensor histidine kinase